ncbi:MAG TPA: DUF5719 family protein [Intrasporangium sp.]|uniref:DUF5719 family protein n=1 Tax=Intrasporangium sp. TaxID=1925024 RepID=UPI002D76A200|nr:DUF5719 family protein [Intrasporangium sp.]HET7398327.1 DUF5719 family protein [Intrasporangium sp.]
MSTLPGIVRATVVALAAAGIVTGAAFRGGSVQLAAPHEQAGLPAVSDVLLDDSTLVCPGQQRLGTQALRSVSGTLRVAAAASPAAALAPHAVPTGAGTVTLATGRAGASVARASARDAVVAGTTPTADPVVASATGGLAPGLAASQSWLRSGDDDRGLAVSPCGAAAADLWFVGGGSGASRTERLVLSNPGANAVSVAFEVFGARGRVASADGRSVSIAPGSRASVSLDAIAPDEPAPAVHVIATGGVVAGVLDDAWIEGATGRGLDDATSAASPATDLVLAGLHVDGTAVLRVANPGKVEAVVRVRVLTETASTQPAELRAVRVPGESSTDVRLASVPTGVAGLRLESTAPVVAGAYVERRARTGTDRMSDFGWAPATPALTGVAGLLVPGLAAVGLRSTLLLAAGPGGATVRVLAGAGGATRVATVTVGPDRAAHVDLAGADRVWVTPERGDVRAAVSVAGADAGGPYFSVAALASAPVTALAVPVRQLTD